MFETPAWGPAVSSISMSGTVTRTWALGDRTVRHGYVAILCFDVYFPSRRRVLPKCLESFSCLPSASISCKSWNNDRGEVKEKIKEGKKVPRLDSPFHLSGDRPRLALRRLEVHPQAHLFAKLMNFSVLHFLCQPSVFLIEIWTVGRTLGATCGFLKSLL